MLHGITKPMTVTKQLQNNMNKHNIKNLKLPDETYTMLLHSHQLDNEMAKLTIIYRVQYTSQSPLSLKR